MRSPGPGTPSATAAADSATTEAAAASRGRRRGSRRPKRTGGAIHEQRTVQRAFRMRNISRLDGPLLDEPQESSRQGRPVARWVPGAQRVHHPASATNRSCPLRISLHARRQSGSHFPSSMALLDERIRSENCRIPRRRSRKASSSSVTTYGCANPTAYTRHLWTLTYPFHGATRL